jgi:hypothetical protein
MARRRFMQSFPGIPARSPFAAKTHPALSSCTDEVSATFARLFAYMGTLALLGILAIHGWDQLQVMLADEPAPKPGWSTADRSYPAFAVNQQDSHEKSAAYTILRHPLGGRKDILRWSGAADKPGAELEIYRPGAEFDRAAGAGLAARMRGASELEAAGVLDSKFGAVALLRQAGVCGRQFMPRLLQAYRRSRPAIVGVFLPARWPAGAPRCDRLHARSPDHADIGQ